MPLLVTTPQRHALGQQTTTQCVPAALAALLSENHSRVLDLFRALDKNLDGEITRPELRSALQKLGLQACAPITAWEPCCHLPVPVTSCRVGVR